MSSSQILSEIAGVPIADLAEQYGTPLYVYDAETIRQRFDELRRFDVVRYAQKACSNLAILALMRQLGAVVDAVSAGEIQRAMVAGYPPCGDPPPIMYTADIFDRDALDLVFQENIHVNCGSRDMIHQLGERAPGREITLRINPGFGHGHSRKTNTGGEWSKHGIWYEQLRDALADAEQRSLDVVGLHIHIGSGTDLQHLAQVCTAMDKAALAAGRNLRWISAGGGLPIPYRENEERIDLDAYHRLWDQTRKRLEDVFGHALRLEIEPGRYLVAEAGYLVAEVRAVKKQAQNIFYLLDAGFNNLVRPVMYGSYHRIRLAPRQPDVPRQKWEVVVGGPLCESGDIFTQEEGGVVVTRRLPQAVVGDYLVIECAGAYGFVMGSNYNSRPLAAEVLIDRGQVHLIRRRQSYPELWQGESIPEALKAHP